MLLVATASSRIIQWNWTGSHLFRPAFLFYEVVMHGSAFFVHRYCVKPLYGDMTEEGIREGRLQNPRLNEFAPVLLPWVGAVYTAHMNVSVAVHLPSKLLCLGWHFVN
jgi:hypothetical protein